jgi:hypothetical protein
MRPQFIDGTSPHAQYHSFQSRRRWHTRLCSVLLHTYSRLLTWHTWVIKFKWMVGFYSPTNFGIFLNASRLCFLDPKEAFILKLMFKKIVIVLALVACAAPASARQDLIVAKVKEIEARIGGRIGIMVFDEGSGKRCARA